MTRDPKWCWETCTGCCPRGCPTIFTSRCIHSTILTICQADSKIISQQYSYGSEITYCLVITGIKASILCMYLRLFGVNKAFSKAVYSFLVMVVAWGVATFFSTIFQCTPISAVWDPSTTNGQCLDYPSWFIGTSVPSILIDFGILVLPITMIWRLKLSTGKKVALTSIFLIGALWVVHVFPRVKNSLSCLETNLPAVRQ